MSNKPKPTDEGGSKYLTVVYRDLTEQEATYVMRHKKVVVLSWSHAVYDRDLAREEARELSLLLNEER